MKKLISMFSIIILLTACTHSADSAPPSSAPETQNSERVDFNLSFPSI